MIKTYDKLIKFGEKFFYPNVLITFITIFLFFLLNPMQNWFEGDIENLYFIYNSLLSSLKIKPFVIDYPGTVSFIINGFFYKIFLSDFSSFTDINKIKDLNIFLNHILIINKYIQLIYLIIFFIFTYKILNELNFKRYINFLLTLALILSSPIIENFQLPRIENDALCFMALSIFFFIRFIKTNNYFFFTIFLFSIVFMLFTKVLFVFLLFILPSLLLFFKSKKLVILFNLKKFLFYLLIFNLILGIFLFLIQYILNQINFISIVFSLFTYGLVFPLLFYFFLILKYDVKKIFFIIFTFLIIFISVLIYTNSNLAHIKYILLPFELLKQHLRGAYSPDLNFFNQIFLIFEKILVNFKNFKISNMEICLSGFIIFSYFRLKTKVTSLDITLFFIYLFFKSIFNIKYYLYYDSVSIFLLILLFSRLYLSSLKVYLISILILLLSINSSFNVLFYKEYRWTNKANSQKIFNKFCKLSSYTEDEFKKLNRHEYYALYYAPNLMNHNNVKKICLKK